MKSIDTKKQDLTECPNIPFISTPILSFPKNNNFSWWLEVCSHLIYIFSTLETLDS